MIASFIVMVVCVITIILIRQDFETTNYTFLIPMILLGIGYSVLAGTLWASIPYAVASNTLGTAFGVVVSV